MSDTNDTEAMTGGKGSQDAAAAAAPEHQTQDSLFNDDLTKRKPEAPEMINLTVPPQAEPALKPCITVVGVGGAGGNAVTNMIMDNLQGVDFVVANTDAQALSLARTERRIQLGASTTAGLGAGARPEVGRAAAEESQDAVAEQLQGSNMCFITAGMGGGTGTGAAPVIARVAREMGILTVGVVTKPFQFEGAHRMRLAESGIEELSQYVDTLIIIPNQNLFRVANERTTFADAFKMADDVLNAGVRSITDLMIMPGLINLDFADVRTVMSDMGRAMMGTGEADGERRALDAAEAAIANPLLEDTCMRGASGVLINITGGPDITLFEVDEAANRIRDEVEGEAHIIFGSCFDQEMEGKMRVSVVATGINSAHGAMPRPEVSQTVRPQPAVTVRAPAESDTAAEDTAPAPKAAGATTGTPSQAPSAPHQAAQQQAAHQQAAAQGAGQMGGQAPRQQSIFAQAAATAFDTTPAAQAQPQVAPAHGDTAPHQASFDMGQAQTQTQAQTQVQTQVRAAGDAFIPAPPVDRDTAPLHTTPQRPAFASAPRTEPRAPLSSAPRTAPRDQEERGTPATSPLNRLKKMFHKTEQASTPREEARVEQHPKVPQQPAAPAPQDEPAARANEEDELEIPAFLRRQAN